MSIPDQNTPTKPADNFAAGGLTGSFEQYAGGNPDIPAAAIAYTADSGRELILTDEPRGGFVVVYDNRHDEDNTFRLSLQAGADTMQKIELVRDALWKIALNDAAWEVGLKGNELYELRETDIGQALNGSITAELLVHNMDTLDYDIITHRFANSATCIERDGQLLNGEAGDIEMAAVFEDMRSEPKAGESWSSHLKSLFGRLLAQAAADPDAPAWVSTSAGTTTQ